MKMTETLNLQNYIDLLQTYGQLEDSFFFYQKVAGFNEAEHFQIFLMNFYFLSRRPAIIIIIINIKMLFVGFSSFLRIDRLISHVRTCAYVSLSPTFCSSFIYFYIYNEFSSLVIGPYLELDAHCPHTHTVFI
jgi:hypothetical protein